MPYLFVVTQWAKKTGVDLSGLDRTSPRFDAARPPTPACRRR